MACCGMLRSPLVRLFSRFADRHHAAQLFMAVLTLAMPACERTLQPMDPVATHWVRFAFTEGDVSITVKVPATYRSPASRKLPQMTFSRINRRELLGVGYDPGRDGLYDFIILGVLVRLQDPLPVESMTPDSVHFAIRTADHLPNWNDGTDKRRPRAEEIGNRLWFHYDGRNYGDDFYARVDDQTLLWISASYSGAVRDQPPALASRKAIARQVVETVGIAQREPVD
jgi:hypothetical protein